MGRVGGVENCHQNILSKKLFPIKKIRTHNWVNGMRLNLEELGEVNEDGQNTI